MKLVLPKGTYIFDLEGDSLTPTKLHVLSCNDGSKIKSTHSYDNMRSFVSKAKVLIGHNITRFDMPVLERILGVKTNAKIVDTLALSWYLYPDRVRHGLADWGEEFGVPKPIVEDWEGLSPEVYKHRCEEDVKINTHLWNKMWKHLMRLYGDEEGVWKLIDYLSFKMDCAREQERSRWRLNSDKATKVLKEMEGHYTVKYEALRAHMPKMAVIKKCVRPAKPFKKDGTYSVTGAKWFALLKRHSLAPSYNQPIEEVTGYKEPNPNSNSQVKDWLFELGWHPQTYKYDRNKDTNKLRKIPQVRRDGKDGKELCPSVLKLTERNPGIKELEGITVLAHRMSILKGFLDNVDEEGYVTASIQGITNTLRFKHKILVNLPGVHRPYGTEIRGCLIAPEGYELLGSDMESLEDRTKQHYMYSYDPDYVDEMNTPGFDPHLDIALLAGMMSQIEVDAYKGGDHSQQLVRHDAKQVNYSATYGVSAGGIVRNTGMKLSKADELLLVFWKRNWAIEQIAKDTTVKTVLGQKWLLSPVSGLWHSLRHEKDRFSTLNQGTGTYCFDMWLQKVRSKRSQLTGQFHDEFILCIKKGSREKAEKLLQWAISEVNKELNLNRELGISIQYGQSYADIH